MLETIVVGIMLFASTNIDDMFLTMAFFADPRLDRRAVVAGKFLGISLIVSMPSEAGSLVAQACSVAGVTAANGGDNLGVYVPVFSEQFQVIPVFAVIFAFMTGLWCIGGNLLVNHRLIAATMRRLAGRLLPWVLIVLGLSILAGARGLVMPVRP